MRKYYLISILTTIIGLTTFAYHNYSFKILFKTFLHIATDITSNIQGKNLILGSSSMLRIKPETHLSCDNWLNRAIGASTIDDIVNYINYTQGSLKPEKILIYAGENDITFGASMIDTFSKYKSLLQLLHEKYPESNLHIFAIKPSPGRKEYINDFKGTNKKLEQLSNNSNNIHFYKAKWDTDIDSLFLEDKVHLTENGYKTLTKGFNETCKI